MATVPTADNTVTILGYMRLFASLPRVHSQLVPWTHTEEKDNGYVLCHQEVLSRRSLMVTALASYT